jgi:replication initiation protein RepC
LVHKDCSSDPLKAAAALDRAGERHQDNAAAGDVTARVAPVRTDIVDAADWLRGEMGISRPLWGEACVAMGRECAAVAVALVSARPAEHFRTSPGGYFHGMVMKAKAGELNLVRTIWGLRQTKAAKARAARPMH